MSRDPNDPDNLSAPPSLADSFERLLAEPADAIVAPLTPGTLVGERYEVVERIGAGAMGMVYLAQDRDLERKIALKLHKRRAGTQQLRREALAMARLAHPNVVTVFEVGEHEGRTFVAMEYVAGTTLRGWLTTERRAPDQVLDVLLAAGEGLVAAHGAKLVHRDFKPENVLIGSDGRARVSDFGLAREVGPATAAATGGAAAATGIAGTPAYMAPEQTLGISVDARADQYAFCAVAWEALVGAWPRDDGPTRHPRIRRVLERGLAKAPAERYPDMGSLLTALRGTRSRSRTVIGGAVLAVAITGATAAFAWPEGASEVSCDGAGIEIAPFALEVPARVSVAQPAKVVTLVADRLARYRTAFAATARTVCRAGLVDKTWSADLHRRGTSCLDLERGIATDLFASSDRTPPLDLVDRVARLVDPTACGDATILASQPAISDDPTLLREIIRVRAALDAAQVDYQSPRAESITNAIALATASSVHGEPTIAPRIELLRATQLRDGGQRKDAISRMSKVYFAARAIDDPELALAALSSLIRTMSAGTPTADLETWLANAEADAQRARTRAPLAAAKLYIVAASTNDGFGDPAKSLAWLREAFALLGTEPSRALADALLGRASVYITLGKPTEAYADSLRAIEMFEVLYGAENPLVATIKINASAGMYALGRVTEATRLATEGEALLDGLLARYPDLSSSTIAQLKLNIASNHINNGDYPKAKELLAEARAMTLRIQGPDDPDLALIDASFAYIANVQRQYDAALAIAKDALVLMDRTTPKPHEDRGMLYLVQSDASRGRGDLETAITAAEASAEEYSTGDERKSVALIAAARAANESRQHPRAEAILAKVRALPAPSDAVLRGRIELETARALASRDRAGAVKAFEQARAIFAEGAATAWVDEVDTARAKLR